MGLGIAQSVMQYSAAQDQADAQNEQARQNAINAANATQAQYESLDIKAMQDDMAVNQKKREIGLEQRKSAATIQTAAGEAGVSGLAVDHVLQDLYAQGGRAQASLDVNQEINRTYLQSQKESVKAGGQNQINSVPAVPNPSFAPYLVDIFSTGLNAYTSYKKRNP